MAAGRATAVDWRNLKQAATGRRKSAYGFLWRVVAGGPQQRHQQSYRDCECAGVILKSATSLLSTASEADAKHASQQAASARDKLVAALRCGADPV